jgi:hypothetical protein
MQSIRGPPAESVEDGRSFTKVGNKATTSAPIGADQLRLIYILNEVNLFTTPKERGMAEHMRHWVIEMNEARQFYLKNYEVVDTIDAAIKTQKIGYESWRYWHSAKNMALH